MKWLLHLFGCVHQNLSFPISTRAGHKKPEAALLTGTYIVCLDCGREFPYDWDKMEMIRVHSSHPPGGDLGRTGSV